MMEMIAEFLKFLWLLPQNICAGVYLWFLMWQNSLISYCEYKDAKVYVKNTSGSVTLGSYIFLSPKATEHTMKHEYGHTRQSMMLGPLYLIIIGIPSILWAATHKTLAPSKPYDWFYTERWADELGSME